MKLLHNPKKYLTILLVTILAILTPIVLPLLSDTKPPKVINNDYGENMADSLFVEDTLPYMYSGPVGYQPPFPGANYTQTTVQAPVTRGVSAGSGGGGAAGGGGGGGGGGGWGGSRSSNIAPTPVIDQQVLSAYDQAIGNVNSGINRLGNQFNSGVSGIDASWQNALNQLLLGRNQGETSYKANKQQSATGYVGAKNTVGAQAGQSLNGLQRLLGSRGAGGSSAATIAAPQAVTRSATLQRGDLGTTFGQNNQELDTNWNNYLTDYGNQVSGVNSQRDQAKQGLQSSIDTNRASLLQTLAQLQAQRASAAGGNPVGAAQPYLDQANSILDKASSYQVAPINYQTQAYQAPSIASYATNQNPTPQYEGAGPSDYFSPYLQALLGKKQQQGAV